MIKSDLIEDLTFQNVYEIGITPEPNQRFTATLENRAFEFEIRTYVGNVTRITIKQDGKTLTANNGIKDGVNLTYPIWDKGAFFFLRTSQSGELAYNFENFGTQLRFYYGTF